MRQGMSKPTFKKKGQKIIQRKAEGKTKLKALDHQLRCELAAKEENLEGVQERQRRQRSSS